MGRITLLIVEIIAGIAIILVLYGLYNGTIRSYIAISEDVGMYIVLFFILLLIIDIFVIAMTMGAWERE